MGDEHSVVEGLFSLPEIEADHLRRRAVAGQPDPQVETAQLGAEADFADPRRGITVQGDPLVDHRGGRLVDALDRQVPETTTGTDDQVDLRDDQQDRVGSRPIDDQNAGFGVLADPNHDMGKRRCTRSDGLDFHHERRGIGESARDVDQHPIGGKRGVGCSQLVVVDRDQPLEAWVVIEVGETAHDRRIGRGFDNCAIHHQAPGRKSQPPTPRTGSVPAPLQPRSRVEARRKACRTGRSASLPRRLSAPPGIRRPCGRQSSPAVSIPGRRQSAW